MARPIIEPVADAPNAAAPPLASASHEAARAKASSLGRAAHKRERRRRPTCALLLGRPAAPAGRRAAQRAAPAPADALAQTSSSDTAPCARGAANLPIAYGVSTKRCFFICLRPLEPVEAHPDDGFACDVCSGGAAGVQRGCSSDAPTDFLHGSLVERFRNIP